MKKIVGILLAGALVTSAFAADFNAIVKMKGNVLRGIVDLDNNANAMLKMSCRRHRRPHKMVSGGW